MSNLTTWFEIPALDINRAKKFYEILFDTELDKKENAENEYYLLPNAENAGGALIRNEKVIPSPGGVLLYLNMDVDITKAVKRIKKAGGRILKDAEEVEGYPGQFAVFVDSEGNRIGVHANS